MAAAPAARAMRWLALPVLLACLAPAAAAEDSTGLLEAWQSIAPILLESPSTTENLLTAAEDTALFFTEWGSGEGGDGLGNLVRQLPHVCC